MRPLLDNQTIRIDNHQRGHCIDWDDNVQDIHLHKYYGHVDHCKADHDDKNWYEIRIPINHKGKITIKGKNNKKLDQIPAELEKEIQQAFGDNNKRDQFVSDIIEHLRSYNTSRKTLKQRARRALGNIRNSFNLDYPKAEVKGWIRNSLKVISIIGEYGNSYYHITMYNDDFFIGELSMKDVLEIYSMINAEIRSKLRFEISQINQNDYKNV